MKLNKLLKITLGMALTAFFASAEPFNVGGLYYEVLSSNEVAVVASPDGTYQSINDVNIPDKVEHDGKPYSVTRIAARAFEDAQMQTLTISSAITEIGPRAFMNSSLAIATLNEAGDVPLTIADSAFMGCRYLYTVSLPERLESIGADAFKRCNLENLVIPRSVKSMGNSAFSQNYNLMSVEFETGRSVPVALGTDLFSNCVELNTVTLPEGVAMLPPRTFMNTGFTEFTIPATLDTIGVQCFGSCGNLETVNCEEGGTHPFIIQDSAFSECISMYHFDMPKRTKSLGDYAFYNNNQMTMFLVRENVETIGEYAFGHCSSMIEFSLAPDIPPTTAATAFFDLSPRVLFYVLEKSFDRFAGLEAWERFYPAKFNMLLYHSDTAPYNTLCVTSEMNPSFVNMTNIKAYKVKEVNKDRKRVVAEQVRFVVGNKQPQGDCVIYHFTTPDRIARCNRHKSSSQSNPDEYLHGVTKWSDKIMQPSDPNVTYYTISRSTGKWRKVQAGGTYQSKSQAYLCANIPQAEAPDELEMTLIDVHIVGDLNGDGATNVTDLSIMMNMLLGVEPVNLEVADLDGNGTLNTSDVSLMVSVILGLKIKAGDLNFDGVVNVSDLTELVNMIMGIQNVKLKYADLTGDGKVNVSDLTALVNIILGV
ncbi:MAG: leucine-rich repeat protein [Muribaculaceae bacterium]|nr:leucine-rich repeat protein [Muribaculaceae bacterium]